MRVLELMKGADATVTEAGARMIQEICKVGGEKGQQEVFDAGAIPVLLESLALYTSNASVCEAVCHAMIIVVVSGSEDLKSSFVDSGAVPLLAAVCKAHSGNAQSYAHYTLNRLGYNDNGSKKYYLSLTVSKNLMPSY